MGLLLVRTALWSAVLILLSLAALQDMRARIIPNRLVLSVAAIGLLAGIIDRPNALWLNFVLAFALLVGLGVLTHYDILGAGDAKMMAAVSLLAPPERIAMLLFAIVMMGGVLSSAYLILHHVLKQRRSTVATSKTTAYTRWLRNERARIVTGESVPYAIAILGGTAAYLVSELHQCLSVTSCSQ